MGKPSGQSLVVLITTANEQQAVKISQAAVRAKLAACANILPKIQSVFRWKGKVTTEEEVLVILKTTAYRYHALEKLIKAVHSYEVPEIIAVQITTGSQQYLEWVFSETHN